MSSSAFSDTHFDVVVIGSGIASTFFLSGLLQSPSFQSKRILVLEAGGRFRHDQLLAAKHHLLDEAPRHFINRTPHKVWHFSRAFGGGTNCWFGSTPRMLPDDFKLRSRYGVGDDWPISYEELESHYCRAEALMAVAGSSDMPYRMSQGYPLPPHRLSEPDQVLKAAYPDSFFHLPTARATPGGPRAGCCNNGVCSLCPIDAKFTIANSLAAVYEHPAVQVQYESPVVELLHSGAAVTGVRYGRDGKIRSVTCDLAILGANALFNPFLLLRSGMDHAQTGLGLCEQVGATLMVTLHGMKNLQGSTVTTGLGFNDMFGEHRRERGGFLYHTVNRAMNLSLERGKELSRLEVIVAIEDLRKPENRVLASKDEERPVIEYGSHSAYAQRTVDALRERMTKYLSPLPVEKLEVTGMRPTESHIQGTTVMGADPASSVVDGHCVHHRYRNLVVLGSGTFPTASPANPSLTIAALSLYAAHHLAA